MSEPVWVNGALVQEEDLKGQQVANGPIRLVESEWRRIEAAAMALRAALEVSGAD